MAFEKAKEYLEGYGLADRIIVTEQSSATVTAAAMMPSASWDKPTA